MSSDTENEQNPRQLRDRDARGFTSYRKPEAVIARAKDLMGNGQNGVWTGTTFAGPPSVPPKEVFALRWVDIMTSRAERFCIRHRYVPQCSGLRTMAIYTDGACSSNGSATDTAHGGWSFVIRDGSAVSGPLENAGPTGQVYTHTSNRAELRAVIGALGFRVWYGEGFERVVIITDSEYVAKHATGFLRQWAARGWKTAAGKPVANQDLWMLLSEKMGEYANEGCEVSFWAVKREWNTAADRAAKAAAAAGEVCDEYMEAVGVFM